MYDNEQIMSVCELLVKMAHDADADSRGIPTHRGWVKKIRFAPGKGNQKLLVMYTDGAEVWDTKEVSPFEKGWLSLWKIS